MKSNAATAIIIILTKHAIIVLTASTILCVKDISRAKWSETMLGASGNGRKINVWNTNKYSNELHTAVLVAFRIPSSVQSAPSSLHWRRYAGCYWNCRMQFIWIFVGAPNVDFSPSKVLNPHMLHPPTLLKLFQTIFKLQKLLKTKQMS